MDGPMDNHGEQCHQAEQCHWAIASQRAFTGRRTPRPGISSPSRVWPLLAAYSHLPLASGCHVGDRPLSGKETGWALVARLGSWGFPHYERLGNRAVDCHGGLVATYASDLEEPPGSNYLSSPSYNLPVYRRLVRDAVRERTTGATAAAAPPRALPLVRPDAAPGRLIRERGPFAGRFSGHCRTRTGTTGAGSRGIASASSTRSSGCSSSRTTNAKRW